MKKGHSGYARCINWCLRDQTLRSDAALNSVPKAIETLFRLAKENRVQPAGLRMGVARPNSLGHLNADTLNTLQRDFESSISFF